MPEVGSKGVVSMDVCVGHLASAFAEIQSESYPDVLSTPAVLGLMERACARVMSSALGEGQLSVGVKTEMAHTQPTALGVTVTAKATLRSIEGALYWFNVDAIDPAGVIATARHARAIVDRASIELRARTRQAV